MTEQEARALLSDLSSKDAQQRKNAAFRLAYPGLTLAVDDLIELAAADPDDGVRKAAIYALGEIGDPIAYPTLQSIWQDTSEPAAIADAAFDACDKLDGLSDSDCGADTGGDGHGRPASEF